MIKFAVVGAGWISQEAFMPGIHQAGNAQMTAIVSGNRDKAVRLAEFHGVPRVFSYEDYDNMLKGDLVDAVYIALPNSMHADYTIRAARAGKHVLVEKPLTDNLRDADAMVNAAQTGGVFLMTAYRLHNEPGTLAMLDRIRSGAIGRPLLAQAAFAFQTRLGNHRLNARHWGGPLQDIGVYCVNAVRHAFAEEPVEVMAMRHKPRDDPRFAEVEATIGATLRFPSGGIAQFVVSFGAAEIDSFQVIGTKGVIELDPAFRFETPTRMRLRRDGRIENVNFPAVDQFAGQIAYFADCIASSTPPEPDGEEGLADMRVLLAIEESARFERLVTMSSPSRPCHPTLNMERRRPPGTRRLLLQA